MAPWIKNTCVLIPPNRRRRVHRGGVCTLAARGASSTLVREIVHFTDAGYARPPALHGHYSVGREFVRQMPRDKTEKRLEIDEPRPEARLDQFRREQVYTRGSVKNTERRTRLANLLGSAPAAQWDGSRPAPTTSANEQAMSKLTAKVPRWCTPHHAPRSAQMTPVARIKCQGVCGGMPTPLFKKSTPQS